MGMRLDIGQSLMKGATQPAITGWFERGLEPAVLLQLTGGGRPYVASALQVMLGG